MGGVLLGMLTFLEGAVSLEEIKANLIPHQKYQSKISNYSASTALPFSLNILHSYLIDLYDTYTEVF